MRKFLFLAMVAIAGMLVGCSSTTKTEKYLWGSYEQILYHQYASPGMMTPELQIRMLETSLEHARAHQLQSPPGFHAHLGYQYLQVGKYGDARRSFETEQKLYPESATLMARFTKKLR